MPRGIPGSGPTAKNRGQATGGQERTTQAMRGQKGGAASSGQSTTTAARTVTAKKTTTATGGSRARGTSAGGISGGGGGVNLSRMTTINATQRQLFVSLEAQYAHAQVCLANFRHYLAIGNVVIAFGWQEDYLATWEQIQKLTPQINQLMRQQGTILKQQVAKMGQQLQFA
jgi:hypothetical protein